MAPELRLFSGEGKLSHMEIIVRRELTNSSKRLGYSHPATLKCIINFAFLLSQEAAFEEAELLLSNSGFVPSMTACGK